MKSIFKAVAVVTIFSVITRALGFIFRIYLSRKLGAEGLGLFQMASSVLGIFLTLISSGIPLTTAKFVSKYEATNNIKKRNQTVSSALVISLLISVVSSILLLISKNLFNFVLTDSRATEILIILIPSITFSAVYSVFRGALWGKSDYFNCGLTELLEQIMRFALTLIFLSNITDYFVATKYSAIAFNLTCLLSAIITIIIYFKRNKLDFSRGEYRSVFKSSMPITGIRLANSFVQPLTTLIIPTMLVATGYSTSEAVASFGVIMGMTFPMLFVPMSVIGSISMVLIPSISSMLSKSEYASIKDNIEKSITVSIFISMLFIPLYLSVGDLIGIVLFNNSMSGILLQLSAVTVLPITLCNLTGSILNALNLEIKSFKNHILGSVLLFVCLIIFTPMVGINSVIISFFGSMSLMTLLNLRNINKALPNFKFSLFSITVKYSFIIIPSSLIGHFISNICLYIFTPLFSALIGGGTAIASTLILSTTFRVYDLKQLNNLINRKRRNKKSY